MRRFLLSTALLGAALPALAATPTSVRFTSIYSGCQTTSKWTQDKADVSRLTCEGVNGVGVVIEEKQGGDGLFGPWRGRNVGLALTPRAPVLSGNEPTDSFVEWRGMIADGRFRPATAIIPLSNNRYAIYLIEWDRPEPRLCLIGTTSEGRVMAREVADASASCP